MKKCLLTGLLFFLVATGLVAQQAYIRPPSIGISFVFYDFTTPERMRTSSMRELLNDGGWASLNEMSPGLAITYFRGLHNRVDFAATVTGSFADNAKPNYTGSANAFLLQAGAEAQFKFLSDQYMFTPYLLVGVGAGKLKNYYSAFMPLGGGFKVNFFGEAAFFIQAKYHLPVTPTTINRHFIYGLGIAGIIGRKREEENRVD